MRILSYLTLVLVTSQILVYLSCADQQVTDETATTGGGNE